MKLDKFEFRSDNGKGRHYNCWTEIGDEPSHTEVKPGQIQILLDHGGDLQTITFDTATCKPLAYQTSHFDCCTSHDYITGWSISEVQQGGHLGLFSTPQPSFRHICTRTPTNPFHYTQDEGIGSYTDYPKKEYGKLFKNWYDVLDIAIDQLPNGGQKELLRKSFKDATKDIGYKPRPRREQEVALA